MNAVDEFHTLLQAAADGGRDTDAPVLVEGLLQLLASQGASDVHLEPTRDAVRMRWRIDGVLQPLGSLPATFGPNVVARLKVLAGLLTYETALPQEGRIRNTTGGQEFRISTFPTLFGEKVVIRALGTGSGQLRQLVQLGFSADVLEQLQRQLQATSGAIVLAGPAGSGKTTTAYACLREIIAASAGGRSIATLEDPVEVVVDGAAQSQVNEAAGFDMATGLRSLLRQDPEVILIGEIRDRATAEIALQAALTGQLVITTFHAGSCAEALHRLIDMGLPIYAIRNALRLIVAQQLVRRLCLCSTPGSVEGDALPLGFQTTTCRVAAGCLDCRQTGYRGRTLLAESLALDNPPVRDTLTESITSSELSELAAGTGGGLWSRAETLINRGATSPAEASRVLGWRSEASPRSSCD